MWSTVLSSQTSKIRSGQGKKCYLSCGTSGQKTIIIFHFSPYSPLNLKSGQVKFDQDKSIFSILGQVAKKLTYNPEPVSVMTIYLSRLTVLCPYNGPIFDLRRHVFPLYLRALILLWYMILCIISSIMSRILLIMTSIMMSQGGV